MAREKKIIYYDPMVEHLPSKYEALGPEFEPQDTHTDNDSFPVRSQANFNPALEQH